jgi:NAD+ synthase (glutamine-hydrolysing)
MYRLLSLGCKLRRHKLGFFRPSQAKTAQFLTRSGQAGYLVPLSGGIDSCATAVMVFSMCRLVIDAYKAGNEQVIADVKRLAKYTDDIPKTPQELCNQLFHTIYMGMSKQSSKETRQRAKVLSEAIGSYHVNLDIDEVYNAQRNLIVQALNFEPKFKVEGGSIAENQTLQNIQASVLQIDLCPSYTSNDGLGDLAW